MTEAKKAYIKTYGCQQNLSDSEKISGVLSDMGYLLTPETDEADIIILNTCAVRESAEKKILGHIGALKPLKQKNPDLMIAVGGCMVQQPNIAEIIEKKYPYVDILFSTNSIDKLSSLIDSFQETGKRQFDSLTSDICFEGIPVKRVSGYRALLPIMYGCDNFCSYCAVPNVRGRERSRTVKNVVSEFESIVNAGYKEIMLLGQNVNSYGKNLEEDVDFSHLLRKLNDVDGDFRIRFMTSHPKDADIKLFETIRDCEKVSRCIHLPFQSGSSRILSKMNRSYSREDYLKLIDDARRIIDDVVFTSDVIVGFPGETEEEFLETLDLIKKVGFYSLFTFIYSRRYNTEAALLPDNTDRKGKVERLERLVALQNGITDKYNEKLVGTIQRGVVTEQIYTETYEVRIDNNAVVVADGKAEIGQFCKLEVAEIRKRRIYGRILDF
ncbi:MAG: tRNA (N6-isopentenyl adenosine(37)-C2)-methylthiotransferase MiaB [Ruminococcaceae bacterium]|nr:tRNA (N6-isopentenyl adenosine(37)-C2)-methylthiotransferase MiaB [Oscillospiraceae bacterium]